MGLKLPFAVAALMIAGVSATALAQDAIATDPMDPQQAHEMRSQMMKDFGRPLRGLYNAEGQQMVDIATLYVEGFADLEAYFPEGSIVAGSKALPEIWENWDEFVVEIDKARLFAADFLVAAETGDQATFLGAAQGLGPVCRECHDSFRADMR